MGTVRSSMTGTVIDLRPPRAVLVLACLFTLAIGAISVYAGVTDGLTTHATGARVAAVVIGGCFLLLCAAIARGIPVALRPRQLVIDHAGIRHGDPARPALTVGWPELDSVWVSRNIKLVAGSTSPAIPLRLRPTPVRLVLVPAGAAFEERHPDLDTLRREPQGRYVLPLGPSGRLVPVLDEALRRFAGGRYTGVVVDHNPIALY